jgi:hypothetical protein
MIRITAQHIDKLLTYKNKAKEIPHWENTILSEKEITILSIKLLPESPSLSLIDKIKTDLAYLPLYTALADWCDPEQDLAKIYPTQILQIAEKLFADKECSNYL